MGLGIGVLVFYVILQAVTRDSGTSSSQRIQPPQPSTTTTALAGTPVPVGPLGVNRGEIASLYPEITFALDRLRDGSESYKGITADKMGIVEIVGPATGPTQISVVAGLANDNLDASTIAVNRADMMVKAVSRGDSRCSAWFLAALKRVRRGDQTTKCAGHQFKVTALPGMVITTATP